MLLHQTHAVPSATGAWVCALPVYPVRDGRRFHGDLKTCGVKCPTYNPQFEYNWHKTIIAGCKENRISIGQMSHPHLYKALTIPLYILYFSNDRFRISVLRYLG